MYASLKAARENVRTAREVVPAQTWEQVNELYLYVSESINQGILRSKRHDFLDGVIQGCQQINGLLEGSMSRDHAWQFLRLGRNLERADMTTRIVDAGVKVILDPHQVSATHLEQVVWGNVLKSVSGYTAFRKVKRASINGDRVVEFLLNDTLFPRAVGYCMQAQEYAVTQLPSQHTSGDFAETFSALRRRSCDTKNNNLRGMDLREYLNDLQIELAELHVKYAEAWFSSIETVEHTAMELTG